METVGLFLPNKSRLHQTISDSVMKPGFAARITSSIMAPITVSSVGDKCAGIACWLSSVEEFAGYIPQWIGGWGNVD